MLVGSVVDRPVEQHLVLGQGDALVRRVEDEVDGQGAEDEDEDPDEVDEDRFRDELLVLAAVVPVDQNKQRQTNIDL